MLKHVAGLMAVMVLLATPALADAAFDATQRSAMEGDAAAQATLAYDYAKGIGTAVDVPAAARWYRKSADQGYLPAYSRLAGIYYLGEGGVARDVPATLKLVNAGVARNDAECLFLLGAFYAEGDIFPPDYALAASYYQRAVDLGMREAYGNLADLYRYGRGVPQDVARARALTVKGAELGSEASAQWLRDNP